MRGRRMSKHLLAGLIVALSPVVALAAGADQGLDMPSSTLNAPGKQLPVAGVVTSVDNNKLSILAPSTAESEITKIGNSVIVEKNQSFQAVTGPLAPQAQIMRDGKKANLNDIKEGDVVHAAYDEANKNFSDIRAVSNHEFINDQQQAKTDLSSPGALQK